MCQAWNGITCWMSAGLLVGLLGCGDSEGSRTVEPLARGAAARDSARPVSSNRVAFVREVHGKDVVLERPASFGLDAVEYARLAAFADELIFAKTKPCVECLSRVLYSDADFFSLGVYRSRAGEPSALANRRKFEEEDINPNGLLLGEVRLATFSRRLGRRLSFDDVFAPGSVPLIQKEIVGFLSAYAPVVPGASEALAAMPTAELRAELDNFALEWSDAQEPCVRFALPGRLVGAEGRHLEVCRTFPHAVFRAGMVSSCETVAPHGVGVGGPIVYDRIARVDCVSPAFGAGERGFHLLAARVEYPVGGFPVTADPSAVAAFMGAVLTEGAATDKKTVEAAIDELSRNFRKKCAEEDAEAHQEGKERCAQFDFCKGRTLFVDGRYLSYQNQYQHGCTCGMGETNGVFGLVLNRALTSHDFIRSESREAVCRLLRRQAVADRNATGVSDSPDLPSYVKEGEWPDTLENFFVDARGITWSYDSCWVYFGGKGFEATTLTWRQLRPYLVSPDVVPLCARTAKGDLNR